MAQSEQTQPECAICFIPRNSEVPREKTAALVLVPESAEKLRKGESAVLEFQSGKMVNVLEFKWNALVTAGGEGEAYTTHGYYAVLSLVERQRVPGFTFEDNRFVLEDPDGITMAMDLRNCRHKKRFEPLDHQVVMYHAVRGVNQAKNTLSAVKNFSINEDGTISPVLGETAGPQWVLADGGLLPTHVYTQTALEKVSAQYCCVVQ